VLSAGQVGYVITSMKSTRAALIGDTWHRVNDPVDALPGFKSMKSNVFCGLYPSNADEYNLLQSVLISSLQRH